MTRWGWHLKDRENLQLSVWDETLIMNGSTWNLGNGLFIVCLTSNRASCPAARLYEFQLPFCIFLTAIKSPMIQFVCKEKCLNLENYYIYRITKRISNPIDKIKNTFKNIRRLILQLRAIFMCAKCHNPEILSNSVCDCYIFVVGTLLTNSFGEWNCIFIFKLNVSYSNNLFLFLFK